VQLEATSVLSEHDQSPLKYVRLVYDKFLAFLPSFQFIWAM